MIFSAKNYASSACFAKVMPMGVNATGTFGGSQVERRRRENQGAVGVHGGGVF